MLHEGVVQQMFVVVYIHDVVCITVIMIYTFVFCLHVRVVKQYIGAKKYCNMYCNIANKYIDIGQNIRYCNIYLLERATNNIAIYWLNIGFDNGNKIMKSLNGNIKQLPHMGTQSFTNNQTKRSLDFQRYGHAVHAQMLFHDQRIKHFTPKGTVAAHPDKRVIFIRNKFILE